MQLTKIINSQIFFPLSMRMFKTPQICLICSKLIVLTSLLSHVNSLPSFDICLRLGSFTGALFCPHHLLFCGGSLRSRGGDTRTGSGGTTQSRVQRVEEPLWCVCGCSGLTLRREIEGGDSRAHSPRAKEEEESVMWWDEGEEAIDDVGQRVGMLS